MSTIDPALVRDWAAIRRRLADLVDNASTDAVETPAAERAVLAARARSLARRDTADDDQSAPVEILRLTMGGQPYAIATEGIVAVVRDAEIVALPGATGPVAYLASWRGRLLTTLDLRPLFGVSAPPTASVLVLGLAAGEVGLLVDSVDELDVIRESEIQPTPPGGATESTYLRGSLADATPLLDPAGVLGQHPEHG